MILFRILSKWSLSAASHVSLTYFVILLKRGSSSPAKLIVLPNISKSPLTSSSVVSGLEVRLVCAMENLLADFFVLSFCLEKKITYVY